MIKLTGLDHRPVYVDPAAVQAIMPAVEGGPGMVGKVVGSCLLMAAGAQVMVKEPSDDVAAKVEAAIPPRFVLN